MNRRQALSTGAKAGIGAAAVVVIGGVAYTVSQPASVAAPITVTQTAAPAQTVTKTAQAQTQTVHQTQVRTQTVEATKTVKEQIGIRPGGTITIGNNDTSENIDPMITYFMLSYNVIHHAYENLVNRNEKTGKIIPNLATEWDSPDGKVWTFKLRKDVTFRNGKKFTGNDVKFTFDRLIKAGTASGIFPFLEGVEVVDDYTVKFVNSKPYSPLDYQLIHPKSSIVPEVSAEDEEKFISETFGSGPFQLTERKLKQSETMVKNPNYWKKDEAGTSLPYPNQINMVARTEDLARVSALRAGEVDIINQLPLNRMKDLKKEEGIVVEAKGATDIYTWGWNHRREPFNDVRVRRAMQFAINKQEIADIALFGVAWPSRGWLPLWDPMYDPKDLGYDPLKAEELLTEAGYPNGFDGGTISTFTAGTLMPEAAVVVQKQMADVGITFDIEVLEIGAYIDKLLTNYDFDCMIEWDIYFPTAGITLSIHLLTGAYGGKHTGLSDPEIDDVIDQLLQETDPKKQAVLSSKAQVLAYDQALWYPMVDVPTVMGLRDYIHGFESYTVTYPYDFRYAWTEKK